MTGGSMSVRMSGGIGPLRVSVPILGSGGGLVNICVLMFKLFGWLLWWELVLCWYLLRGIYWDGPRAAWRWWQRRD
ncbi:hypothetical protein [Streptomyces sp. NPDC005046]